MLSFNAYLDEKKSQIKVNPRKADLYEKEDCSCDKTEPNKKVCQRCMGTGLVGGETCPDCGGKGYVMESEGEGEGSAEGVAEAFKKKDDTYLETDFKKRQKNNEKASQGPYERSSNENPILNLPIRRNTPMSVQKRAQKKSKKRTLVKAHSTYLKTS